MHALLRLHVLSVLTLSIAAGCGSAPPPALKAPPLRMAFATRGGGLLDTMPFAVPEAGLDPSAVWRVKVRSYFVDASVLEGAAAAEAPRTAAVLLNTGGSDPIRGTLPALRELKLARGQVAVDILDSVTVACEDPAKALLFDQRLGALPDGAASELEFGGPDGVIGTLIVAREGERVRIALRENESEGPAAVRAGNVAVLLSDLVAEGEPAWLQFAAGSKRSIGLAVEILPGSSGDEEHAALVKASAESLTASSEALRNSAARWSAAEAGAKTRALALEGLGRPADRRNALLVLRGEQDGLATDYALVAEDAALDRWIERLRKALGGEGKDDLTAAAASWAVEHAAIESLGARVEGDLASAGEAGLLLRRYGEAGRFVTDLLRAARGAVDEAGFDIWVRSENRRLLGSSDPAARVRALDWLTRQDAAPDGFDPFASRDERRAALRAADAAAEQSKTEDAQREQQGAPR